MRQEHAFALMVVVACAFGFLGLTIIHVKGQQAAQEQRALIEFMGNAVKRGAP